MVKTRRVRGMDGAEDSLAKAKLKMEETVKRDIVKIPKRELAAMAETKTIVDKVFARLGTIEKEEQIKILDELGRVIDQKIDTEYRGMSKLAITLIKDLNSKVRVKKYELAGLKVDGK